MTIDRIPLDTLEGLHRYRDHHVPPGGFLYAILSNDLYRAVGKADDANRRAFFDIVEYVNFGLPMNCRGSADVVKAWLARVAPAP